MILPERAQMNTKHQVLLCQDKAAQQLVCQAFVENLTGGVVTGSLSLLNACLLVWWTSYKDMSHVCCSGGYVVISHPLGRRWLNETMHSKDPVMVPHLLPDQAQLESLIADLPLRIHSYLEEDQLYIATLQVMPSSTNLPRSVDAPSDSAISCLSWAICYASLQLTF